MPIVLPPVKAARRTPELSAPNEAVGRLKQTVRWVGESGFRLMARAVRSWRCRGWRCGCWARWWSSAPVSHFPSGVPNCATSWRCSRRTRPKWSRRTASSTSSGGVPLPRRPAKWCRSTSPSCASCWAGRTSCRWRAGTHCAMSAVDSDDVRHGIRAGAIGRATGPLRAPHRCPRDVARRTVCRCRSRWPGAGAGTTQRAASRRDRAVERGSTGDWVR